MQRIFDAFEKAGKELFLVGGAVRELARGIDFELIDDLDFCTNARPQETLEILRGAKLTIYDVGIEFGTVGTVLYSDTLAGYPKDCQITTYRSEEYYRRGSRHPQVSYGDTLEQDLKRRDFSINSIAMNARGEYIDPYDGVGDLARGILRVVGDPHETLAEDPLRILRVGRFIAKLGFDADESLREACEQRADCILEISRERWLQEMTKLVMGAHAPCGLEFLRDVRILGNILPEVAALSGFNASSQGEQEDCWAQTMKILLAAERTPVQRWAALLHLIGEPGASRDEAPRFERHEERGAALSQGIAERFRFDNAMTRELRKLIEAHGLVLEYERGCADPGVRRLVRALDPYFEGHVALARATLEVVSDDEKRAGLEAIGELVDRAARLDDADDLRPRHPRGLGKEVMTAFHLKPGPIIGQIKDYLEEQMLDGTLRNGAEASLYIEHLRAHTPDFLAKALGQDGE